MLSETERKAVRNLDKYNCKYRAVLRQRIIKKAEKATNDLILILNNADNLHSLEEKIPPKLMQRLVNSYFRAFKVKTAYSDPNEAIRLINENVLLKRKNAKLEERIGDILHEVEHFKYIAAHSTQLLEMERNGTTEDGDMTAP